MSFHANNSALGIVGVLIAAFLWGTTGTAASFAPNVSPAAIGSVAMGIGGLLQAAIAYRAIEKSRARLLEQWRLLIFGALAVAIYPLAFYASMRFAGVTIGTVITIGSAPLLSALIENRMDGLRLSKRWISGAALGLAGMLLICFAKAKGHGEVDPSSLGILGVLLGLVAGFTYALYSWTAWRMMQTGISSQAAMGSTFGIGGILLMPVLLITGAPLLESVENFAVGAYMATVPMFIGYVCFGYGLARIPASTATTITLIEPAVAAMLAVFIVGERLAVMGWIGVILVIGCLFVITLPIKTTKTFAT
ncbi:putative permease, DMT superfamily protein [Advenella kashmirensis WT001]|uniref:Putative permease, DMT superfamily protein n=1 Tax=Advenella kashmirensis (strain DSM 17095 / LMG 22695 / WT001) TaxID=1036672 RepID=I3U6V3_ADVKW|nr:EamA family transporter [Advenella kashmirensis]AFK60741.1 putative permease, DMT superfamily protein [Advenella kashmirensis WT001]